MRKPRPARKHKRKIFVPEQAASEERKLRALIRAVQKLEKQVDRELLRRRVTLANTSG